MSEIKYCLECGSNNIVKNIYSSEKDAVYCKECNQELFHSVKYGGATVSAFDNVCSKLDKAIKALEFYASIEAYDQVEDPRYSNTRFALIEEDELEIKTNSGFTINVAGKFAIETLKEIRGEK